MAECCSEDGRDCERRPTGWWLKGGGAKPSRLNANQKGGEVATRFLRMLGSQYCKHDTSPHLLTRQLHLRFTLRLVQAVISAREHVFITILPHLHLQALRGGADRLDAE